MILISLTEAVTGEEVKISDDDILRVFDISSGTGANVLYSNKGATPKQITVNETASQVTALSKLLIQVTVDSITEFINAARIIKVTSQTDGGTGSLIEYDAEGASNTFLNVSESKDALQNSVNDHADSLLEEFSIIDGNRTLNQLNVAGNQTAKFTAGKTFTVKDSTNIDGTYSVTGSVFGANTAITVSQDITSSTFDGTIVLVDID